MFEVWLSVFVILSVLEMATVNLVSVWFAVGALVAAASTLFTSNTTIQLAVFVISSAITLALTKPLVEKVRTRKIIPTNLDRVIGKIGVVTEEITKLDPGEVKVDGKHWSATSTKKIQVDRKVEVLSIDGVKLHVKEVKEED